MCDCDSNPQICGGDVGRKARKPHKCSECGRIIAKGEEYREHSGLWRDGGWSTYRWCGHCQAAQKIVAERTNEHCWCYEQLWQGITDEMTGWGGIRDMAVYRLVVAANRRWTIRRGARKGQLMPIPVAPIKVKQTA
jgi:hypothetical protein